MTQAKWQTLAELAPRWGVTDLDHPAEAFKAPQPLLVDIGCGTGQATRAWASQHPDRNVVAIELHRPGLVRLLSDLAAEGPDNVRVLEADATAVLDRWHRRGVAVAEVRVLFPDPWPKRRHRDRRLVDLRFVSQVADLLEPGGRLHVATDSVAYADSVRSALSAEPRLSTLDDAVSWSDASLPEQCELVDTDVVPARRWRSTRPERPLTTYEQRGLTADRPVTDLVALRRSD